MATDPPRKTEDCEFCLGRHYSEKARFLCFKKHTTPACTCPRYWRVRWESHAPGCSLRNSATA